MESFENIKVIIQSIFDGLNEALIIIEESGQILLINKTAKNIFRYEVSKTNGRFE